MILDTNALSAWLENDASLYRVLRSDHPWYLPAIVLGEFRYGILGSDRGSALESWLEKVEASCSILAVDAGTAPFYAELRNTLDKVHRKVPYHDIWIGALALQHGLAVLTRDAHFDLMPGVRRIGW